MLSTNLIQKTNKNKLIAISGGVDSMLLAYKYRNKQNIILVYVNYNIRKDSYIDERIVKKFAKINNLRLEILNVDKNTKIKNNFENWAREIRYDFFKKIYQKYNCNQLLIAHHKDDFLETAIMQEEKNNKKLFLGIKQKTTFKSMKIYRPFLLKYWKEDIYKLAKKYNIEYHEDSTNLDTIYKRNQIRNQILKFKSIKEKEEMINKFLLLNKDNLNIIKKINNEYKLWRKTKFSTREFENYKYQEELIKKYINYRADNINLNQNILKNIVLFFEAKENNKKFLLSNNNFLFKKNNRVFFRNF